MSRNKKRHESSNKRQKFFFVVFCFLVLINPFPLGSNRAWAWSFEAMIAFGLLVLMVACSLFSNECISWHRLKKMKTELVLIGAWLLINLIYLIPLPLSFIGLLSPNVAQAYIDAGASYGYLTLDVYASFKILMLSVYYFVLFVLGVILISSRKRIRLVLFLFLALGVFEAVYGMYLVSVGQTGTLVQVTSVASRNASGTFINKNHLVAFLSMSFILGLSLRLMVLSRLQKTSHLDWKIRAVRYISQPLRLLDFGLFLILTGIWATHSRAGLASFLLAILFFSGFLFFSKRVKSINYKAILTAFALVVVLLIVVADDVNYFMESLGQRSDDGMQRVLSSAEGRLLAVDQAVNNIHQYWFSGVGPGAYQVFFVNHRMLEQTAFFDHAHNDYIEFAVEYGVLSLLLLVLLLLFLYRIIVFIFKTQSSFYKILGIGVVSSMIYLLLHGNMDFNARIPANIVTIIVANSVIYGRIMIAGMNK